VKLLIAGGAGYVGMNLIDNMDKFQDWENPLYSNIGTFRGIEHGIEIHGMSKVL
jgi:hypothetical protein